MHSTIAHHAVAHAASPVTGRLLLFAALAGLLSTAWRRCRATHLRRTQAHSDAKPEKLQVWEDEGGQNQMPDAPGQAREVHEPSRKDLA